MVCSKNKRLFQRTKAKCPFLLFCRNLNNSPMSGPGAGTIRRATNVLGRATIAKTICRLSVLWALAARLCINICPAKCGFSGPIRPAETHYLHSPDFKHTNTWTSGIKKHYIIALHVCAGTSCFFFHNTIAIHRPGMHTVRVCRPFW